MVARLFPRGPQAHVPEQAEPLPQRSKPAAGETLLSVDKARKEFGGLVAVNDVSFEVRAGEIVGLIGPNGAGKSTTFNLVTGALRATRGEITFRGERIDALASRQIVKRGIGRTFQHVKLLPGMSVLENVAIGAHLRGHAGVWRSVVRLNGAEEGRLMAEAAQQIQLLAAEQGDVGDGFCPGKDGEQAEEKDLRQRVIHLPLLAWILQAFEMTQEDVGRPISTLLRTCILSFNILRNHRKLTPVKWWR